MRKLGESKTEKNKITKSPYNPNFVEKIKRSAKSRGKAIKTEDLWK
ncbi:MAG: hypothetical protein IK017_01570 [Paludibacteraceae bacterium]|nr:hypothetical protein [Paludibacteraceae bacterium]